MKRHKTRARRSGRRTRKQSGGFFGLLSNFFGSKPAPVQGQVATPAVGADPNNKPEEKPGFLSNLFGPKNEQGGGSRKKSKKHHHRHRHHRK